MIRGNKTGKKKEIYETVRGIRFSRKVTRRKHRFSFLDDTPRLMTEEEERRYYKKPDPERVRYITKIKDMGLRRRRPAGASGRCTAHT